MNKRKGTKMFTEFKSISIGTVFYKDDQKGIKQSTRTARAIGPTDSVFNPRIFYVGQKEIVHIKERKGE
tara:strand:+ start:1749 stop:1955 length:207 start_codon:yes stop_codon:yes gene_type:complete